MSMVKSADNLYRLYYDFDICFGSEELKRVLAMLNYNGYELVAVTQTMDKYTVFFRRLVG